MAKSWMVGGSAAAQARADLEAARALKRDARGTPTEFWDGETKRCAVCGGQPHRDVDEIKCLSCGRTLVWFGKVMTQQQAQAEVARSRERFRLAAEARWKEKPHKCQAGHPMTDDNVLIWGGRPRCKLCYIKRRKGCPQGHEYTAENTAVSRAGRRRCVKCVRDGRYRKNGQAAA